MPSPVFLSARHQAASFETEAEMTDVAIRVARDTWWRSPDRLDFVATEVVAGGARADAVGVSFDTKAVRRRISHGIAPLTEWTAIVCTSLCGQGATVSEIMELTGLTRSGAGRSLGVAVDHGAVVRDGRRFSEADAWETPVREAVAVELKLRDWQKGLSQTIRYRQWADASWLILGATASHAAARAAMPNGVGLLRLTPEGRVQRGRVARYQRPRNRLERIWIEEQALKQALAAGWRPDAREHSSSLEGAPAFALC
jgi:hypothetical protein